MSGGKRSDKRIFCLPDDPTSDPNPDATGIASPCQREQRRLRADTLEAAGYIVVLTTLTALSARQVLELYQHR